MVNKVSSQAQLFDMHMSLQANYVNSICIPAAAAAGNRCCSQYLARYDQHVKVAVMYVQTTRLGMNLDRCLYVHCVLFT